MRKVIRKQIRRKQGGINLAADVNAVIATGEGEKTHTSASSHQRVVQRSQRSGDPPPPADRPEGRR